MSPHPIIKFRYLLLAAFVALSAWLVPGVSRLQNDDDVLAFLPPDHPDVETFREVAGRFGMLEVALIGLSAEDGDGVLTLERVEAIRTLSREVGENAGVNLVLSYTELPHPEIVEGGMVVAPLVPTSMTDEAEIRERVLGSRDAVGNLVSKDGDAAALLVFLLPRDGDGAEAFAARRTHLEQIRRTVESGWDAGPVRFGGAPYIEMAASDSSRTDIERLSPLVIGVLAVVSAVLLRSVVAAAVNLVVTALGVGLIVGAHGVFGEPFTIVSSSTPVMMVALGGAFGMHVLAGYQRQSGSSVERASAALRELWVPVVLSGVTTSVAFFALLVMPQVPMQRFGLVAGLGVLLLLALALLLIPSLLAILPSKWIKTRTEKTIPLPPRPPAWLLAGVALIAAVTAAFTLRPDPDTNNVFDADSEPAQASAFFDQHFGGSTFVQITVDGELAQAEILRRIQEITEEVGELEGVVDVRSVVEPVAVLNEALGGRRGVPETSERARRVLTYLIGHPAMAQLMTRDADGALIHVKLAPMDGDAQVELTAAIREIVERYDGPTIAVGSIDHKNDTPKELLSRQRAEVQARLARRLGIDVDLAKLDSEGGEMVLSPGLEKEILEFRREATDAEEGFFEVEVPDEERDALQPEKLLNKRGKALEDYLTKTMPTVAEGDPEGITFAADHLASWIDDAKSKYGVEAACGKLELSSEQCESARPILGELDDEEWDATGLEAGLANRTIPFVLHLTGQPVIGQAFAESVSRSLWRSTLVSLLALAIVLAISRSTFALVPAVWTLLVTGGILGALGHPISVGTSMVACIALGTGVDFAIHLGVRARREGGENPGEKAVDAIGTVIVISAIQLSAAFLILGLSDMTPLRQFGVGLAVGLTGAGLGAVWLSPMLLKTRNKRTEKRATDTRKSKSGQD